MQHLAILNCNIIRSNKEEEKMNNDKKLYKAFLKRRHGIIRIYN